MTLHAVPIGRRARITDMRDQPLAIRMMSMGIRPGAELLVLARAASGSRIVRVGDARVSVARELALGIEVELLDVQ